MYFSLYILLFFLLVNSFAGLTYALDKSADQIKIKPQLRFIRAFGSDDERKAPILILQNSLATYSTPLGEQQITIELDIAADVPPAMYVKFVHCAADWREDNNVFLNDLVYSRTSNISWESASTSQNYFNYRARLAIPNEQIKFKYSGNWKAKFYLMDDDETVFAEQRIFVVLPRADCQMYMSTEMYTPSKPVTNTALSIESVVVSNSVLIESNLNTVVFYKNHRWFEPHPVTMSSTYEFDNQKYKYQFPTMINGFLSMGKRFRIERLPAENGYRVINLADMGYFPQVNSMVRLPFSDVRRRGSFDLYDDDGALITQFVTYSYDEYVYLEFLLEPDGWITNEELYVSGSFNNWNPDKNWQMYFDENDKYYKLHQWVRRGRHNYLYTTGKYDFDSGRIINMSNDVYEGNTSVSGQTYLAMVYYREFEYGGYDALIAVGASTIYGNLKR